MLGTYAVAGTKRSRPVESGSPNKRCGRRHATRKGASAGCDSTLSSSESESEESYLSSESELGDDAHDAEFWESKFQTLREDALKFSQGPAQRWMDSMKYSVPPDDYIHHKRPRAPGLGSQSTQSQGHGDRNDAEPAGTTKPAKYFHLSCPFYVSEPNKYKNCLLRHDLQSVDGLIQHLGWHHMKPPYCPMCYGIFDSVADRDRHILKRTCTFCERRAIDGVDQYQWFKLTQRGKSRLGEAARCKRVWAIVFPDSEPPGSFYLQSGHGLEVSMIRDYWRDYGPGCMGQFLESRGFLGGQENNNEMQMALSKLTLKDLIGRITEKYQCSKKCIEGVRLEIRIKDNLEAGGKGELETAAAA